jgi:hypothetical protein
MKGHGKFLWEHHAKFLSKHHGKFGGNGSKSKICSFQVNMASSEEDLILNYFSQGYEYKLSF